MYFDFEESRPDTPTYPHAVTTREGILISLIFHLLFVILLLIGLPFDQAAEERRLAAEAELQRQQLERERDNPRFVFMQPRVETPPPRPPQRAELSDRDRQARSVARAPEPRNPLPFSRGTTTERIDAAPEARAMPGPAVAADAPAEELAESPVIELPDGEHGLARAREASEPRSQSTGILSDAIRNVQRYARQDGFVNLQGGQNQDFGPFINFDSKGVEFGPWIARFVAQVRRNWFIPMAAMTMRGHVVVTFFVHKDGRITEVTVAKPSSVDAFTLSARNAILASNPTVPLPPEYPDDRAFFTVTFFFNESPP